jgi:HEAT repeat protein
MIFEARIFSGYVSFLGPGAILLCLIMSAGCAKEKSTSELLNDAKYGQGKDKIGAVRALPERGEEPAKVIETFTEALKDKSINVRRSSAIALGAYGEQAKEAVPALQLLLKDSDARVREAASVALSRIDPSRFSGTSKANPAPEN